MQKYPSPRKNVVDDRRKQREDSWRIGWRRLPIGGSRNFRAFKIFFRFDPYRSLFVGEIWFFLALEGKECLVKTFGGVVGMKTRIMVAMEKIVVGRWWNDCDISVYVIFDCSWLVLFLCVGFVVTI